MNTVRSYSLKSFYQMGNEVFVARNLCMTGCLCLAAQLFGSGTAWIGYPTKQATNTTVVPGRHSGTHLSQDFTPPQSPDTMVYAGAPLPVPDGEAPLPRDTRGEAIDMASLGSTVYEQIGINRVVSYLTSPNGTLDPSVFASGIVSTNARLTLIVHIVGSPRDNGKPVKVVFSSLNGNPISDSKGNPVQFTFYLGDNSFEKLNPISVPCNRLHFGIPNPNLNPLQTSALTIIQHPDSYKPSPGRNELDYSFYSSLTQGQILQDKYTAYIYSYLEFDTLAPIVLVHGTNASHTSWMEPTDSVVIRDPNPLGGSDSYYMFDPFVSSATGQTAYFEYPETSNSTYKGVWYSNINLGIQSGGNDGIAQSADDLMNQLFAVYYVLGARTCHVIAHSKGGTDARMLLLAYGKQKKIYFAAANSFDSDDLLHKVKVLSLYTMGTPHMGTPLSDISDQISPLTAAAVKTNLATVVSPDARISVIGNLTTLIALINPVFGIAPKGEARADQRVSSDVLSRLRDNDYSSVVTSGHVYNIIGDADLDKSLSITGNETAVVDGLPTHPNSLLDINYYIVGRVGSVLAVRSGAVIELIPTEYKASTPEPNDWVSPFWGALSPGATVFQVNGIVADTPNGYGLWSPPQGISPSIDLNYASTLSPGNHSILKSAAAAATIVQNILADYPIQDPMSSGWK